MGRGLNGAGDGLKKSKKYAGRLREKRMSRKASIQCAPSVQEEKGKAAEFKRENIKEKF